MNMRMLIRLIVVALLGATTALLVSCGSSGKGLIPTANGTALQSDFEEVARAAEAANGNCKATEAALGKTEQDFLGLPTTIDKGLRKRLEEGIEHLHKQALGMCEQPAATDTSTTSTQTTSTPTTGTTNTETSTVTAPSTTTSPTTPTSPATTPTTNTPQNPGGGVEAPEEGSGERGVGAGAGAGAGAGIGKENGGGNGASNSGGASAGGAQ